MGSAKIVNVELKNRAEIEEKLKMIGKQAPKALKLAVNDTARKARSRLANKAQEKYVVKGTAMNKAAKLALGTVRNPSAKVVVSGKPIELYKFARRKGTKGKGKYFNPTLNRLQTGKGGKAAMAHQLDGRGMKNLQVGDRKAFLATMKSGHKGIFIRRAGKKRGEKMEIRELMGSSIPIMVGGKKGVYKTTKPYIKKDLNEALERHIQRALRGEKL